MRGSYHPAQRRLEIILAEVELAIIMCNTSQSEEREREKKLLGLQLSLGLTDEVFKEERLCLQAQYEDKHFLQLIGNGIIKRDYSEKSANDEF